MVVEIAVTSFVMSKSFSTMLAVFPLQLGLHNFNLKSCSLMLNPKAADFLLWRKRKWKQGRKKQDQQGFTILGGCSWGEKHSKEGRRRSRLLVIELNQDFHSLQRVFSLVPSLFFSFLFKLFSKFFSMNSLNFSSYFNSINKKRIDSEMVKKLVIVNQKDQNSPEVNNLFSKTFQILS